jgi:hemoglobin
MTERRSLKTKEDVNLLVTTFYGKIKDDALLGPIFNGMISDWEAHLQLLTNFWCKHLRIASTYNGNPIEIHRKVDAFANNSINQEHFGVWINYWIETLDELFEESDEVFLLKNKARKMASFIHIDMFKNRP